MARWSGVSAEKLAAAATPEVNLDTMADAVQGKGTHSAESHFDRGSELVEPGSSSAACTSEGRREN